MRGEFLRCIVLWLKIQKGETLTPDIRALSYILTSPPRRVCKENLQQAQLRNDEYTNPSVPSCVRVRDQKAHTAPKQKYRKECVCIQIFQGKSVKSSLVRMCH